MSSIQFAAIDIGSNAVRLLIKSIEPGDSTETFTKVLMVRVPLRLGQESFVTGKISNDKAKQLVRLMKAFKQLIKIYDIEDYRACATAAMRDAKNTKELVKEINKETNIKIEIISGQEEAAIIYESHFADSLNKELNYIYVDVGGGSTEISVITKGELIESKSYDIGTVRLLNNKVKSEEYERLNADLSELKVLYKFNDIIGSGGNIIKLNTLAKVRKNNKLSLVKLEELNTQLKALTVDERKATFKLKPDRADVITLAADIYTDVAKGVGAGSIIVPTIGLSDGIIHMLYMKWKDKNLVNQSSELEDNQS
ncbi:Ppx/GppA phosphatase [Paludibacter propionicigenes WB4]|uniref:Ppx/GppA phosphatase n=1 Tax=Paludibacter propionicigenes (strain DSM 17365 / JCM 13257 / WB4) TaxID=694427 RepID=E4T598_PALPW|nr:exopolyphosphatase [Paludibacter propionicigenes]ADQ79892.1 Ppx/GppA phosphatase [Paludibacter propionicigenes WB4]